MVFTDEPVEPEEPTQVFDGEVSNTEMYWVSDHYDELLAQYGGEWIAVLDDHVVAHARKLSDVRKQLDEMHLNMVFLEKIPIEDQANGFVVA